MAKKPLEPFRLVPDEISHDTVEALRDLLRRARAGEIIGIAFAAMHKGRVYLCNTAGESTRNPTFTRGMLRALDDKLARAVHGKDEDE